MRASPIAGAARRVEKAQWPAGACPFTRNGPVAFPSSRPVPPALPRRGSRSWSPCVLSGRWRFSDFRVLAVRMHVCWYVLVSVWNFLVTNTVEYVSVCLFCHLRGRCLLGSGARFLVGLFSSGGVLRVRAPSGRKCLAGRVWHFLRASACLLRS